MARTFTFHDGIEIGGTNFPAEESLAWIYEKDGAWRAVLASPALNDACWLSPWQQSKSAAHDWLRGRMAYVSTILEPA